MSLNNTPKGNRLHIGIFGRRNAGKSSLINALAGQARAIVSDTPGTTADPVFKSMELHPIGPVVLMDTAGFDDDGELGKLRVDRTTAMIDRTDLAILLLDGTEDPVRVFSQSDVQWLQKLQAADIPTIVAVNKCDVRKAEECAAVERAIHDTARTCLGDFLDPIFWISAKTGSGIDRLRQAIIHAVPEDFLEEELLKGLVTDDSLVLLVMPQDIQAPKGRLILPQVQTIRELLDRKCTVLSTTADRFTQALSVLNRAPDLIITDSQCFNLVSQQKPQTSRLTSFSILMAAAKGDIRVFVEGVSAMDQFTARIDEAMARTDDAAVRRDEAPRFRVLIAEACAHVPLKEDIGTVKIPMLLHKQYGDQVEITSVRGDDFPQGDELKQYDLIIHCGACMFNRKHVLSRIDAAEAAGVPITNYGIFLAKMAGILDKVCLP